MLWFHALSVGESLALVPLIELAPDRLPQAQLVLTISTATSVAALEKAQLPDRCHQVLLPIDTPKAVRRFLDHWRPELAAFAELDFWPRLMVETSARGVPMALINSRMPDGNFARRKRLGGMMRDVLRLFDRLLVQDQLSAERFAALGAAPDRISTVGALKAAARPLPEDQNELEVLQVTIGARLVWLAAATEASEHAAMLEAHDIVLKTYAQALLIIAPRFPADADDLVTMASRRFSSVARRSAGQALTETTQVYVADTGTVSRLCPLSGIR